MACGAVRADREPESSEATPMITGPAKMWKRILVPHDFSPCAVNALRVAVELAGVHRAAITILHVSDLPENLTADTVVSPPGERSALPIADYTTRGAVQRLEAIAEPLRREGLSVLTKTVTGGIAEEILLAAKNDTDVLVLGTHGRTGLSHLLVGSVAEKIVRCASVPVVTVRSRSPEAAKTNEERDAEDELSG